MNRLREKMKSSCGASILLALLFLLICVLVAVSVLMAASSNAGKIRSNKEEQQRYFTLSSALKLVCDELANAEYMGNYTVETEHKDAVMEADGITIKEPAYDIYTYTQKAGTFTCQLKGDLLPLTDDLDKLFAGRVTLPVLTAPDIYADPAFVERTILPMPTGSHTLTLQVDDTSGDYPGLTETVTVELELLSNGGIYLTATLGTADASGYVYTMEARLNAKKSPDAVFRLDGSGTTEPMTWELDRIAKKGGF